MGQPSLLWTMALVVVIPGGLIVSWLRGPKPQPKRAPEPPHVVVLRRVSWLAAAGLAWIVGANLPNGLAIPVLVGVAVVAIAASRWWDRRHPPVLLADSDLVIPPPREALAIPTAEWVRGLLVVLAVAGVGTLLFALISRAAGSQ